MDREIATKANAESLLLSVIIPARNEAESIRSCLDSLVKQSEETFLLGQQWELIVVDDDSIDETQAISEEVAGVTVLNAPPLQTGWTGKANALWSAAQQARGKWLLFTDADTVHEPGSLRRAIHEADRYHVALLSYSPRQSVHGFVQRALMPLIFGDLVQKYPPRLVNAPESPVAAANGQFLMMERGVYRRIGGHAAVHASIIEDLDLAHRCKQAKEGIRLRYAPDAVSARMYRSFATLYEGWVKNLAALFPDALVRGLGKVLMSLLLFGLPLVAIWMYLNVARTPVIWAIVLWWAWRLRIHYSRVAKAHFSAVDSIMSPLALPLFAWMLLASWLQTNVKRQVTWKGRSYAARR
ncbi:MAG TPA: glycosyltransferase family 2 protein [Acidobacteriaceae bacterium]|nr:glycosyltransferase family 2 protein [Acidobacteriaceae bacterium]